MIDAGGGSGLYSVTLCQKYPELHSTIVKLKDTLVVTKEMIRIEKKKGELLYEKVIF